MAVVPRSARASVGGLCYHVLNRGNARQPVFHKDGDYDAFSTLLAQAQEHQPMRLVERAETWPWSSLRGVTGARRPTMLHAGPVPRPRDWLARVNRAETPAELEALRRSVTKGTPLGSPRWVTRTAARLDIPHTLRDRGRPKKARPRRS